MRYFNCKVQNLSLKFIAKRNKCFQRSALFILYFILSVRTGPKYNRKTSWMVSGIPKIKAALLTLFAMTQSIRIAWPVGRSKMNVTNHDLDWGGLGMVNLPSNVGLNRRMTGNFCCYTRLEPYPNGCRELWEQWSNSIKMVRLPINTNVVVHLIEFLS